MQCHRTAPAAVAHQWNLLHPIGTRVRYWPGSKSGAGQTGVTISKAFLLAGHSAVLMIDTARSCVALSHVEAIVEGEPAGEPRPAEPRQRIACPACHVMKDVVAHTNGYYCHHCRLEFDGDPNEGGDFDDRDPARRLERQEERRGGR